MESGAALIYFGAQPSVAQPKLIRANFSSYPGKMLVLTIYKYLFKYSGTLISANSG